MDKKKLDNKWSVRDLTARIEKDAKPVGLYLRWASWFVVVPPEEAVNILTRRLSPDDRISVTWVGDTPYIGYES
jgi:hypothetical protein